MEFKDRVAVITGAASGIGRAVALVMAGLGTDVVAADINDARLTGVCREIGDRGRRALAVHCDVSKDADMENLADRAISAMGKVDILVNNAGIAMQGSLEKMSTGDWECILGINTLGAVRGVRVFLPHMLERGSGYIVNTASITGILPTYGPPEVYLNNIGYSTSKFATVGFSENLYHYLRPKGIMVSVLCPGGVDTNIRFNARYVGENPEEIDSLKAVGENVFKEPGMMEPDEVARILIEAMKEGRFLVLTHPEVEPDLLSRGQDLTKLEKHLQDMY